MDLSKRSLEIYVVVSRTPHSDETDPILIEAVDHKFGYMVIDERTDNIIPLCKGGGVLI